MGLKTNPDVKDAYALIVGISTYKDAKIPKLNYTTHDAQAIFDNFFASALSNSDFNRLLLSIKSKRLVVFMDSCYSGGVSEKKARDVKIVEDPYEKMREVEI